MKNIITAIFFFSCSIAYGEVTLEPIPTKYQSIMSLEWYTSQVDLWHQEIAETPGNAKAWLNYYTAARYAKKEQSVLDSIVEKMEKAVPGSFELSYIKAWNMGFDEDGLKSLEQAYQKDPNNPLTYGNFMVFYELLRNKEKKAQFARKLFESHFLPEGLLNYSYNVLMSVEENGILFTQGDNTTVPLWVLQDALKIRPDVQVLNTDLLLQDEYRQQMLFEESLQYENEGAFLTDNPTRSIRGLLNKLPIQNPDKKFYYALTLSNKDISSVRDRLFVVGLASQISDKNIDNIAVIKKNLEKRFLLDYLKVDFNGESSNSTAKVLSQNYLIPIILLNQHYRNSGEDDKAEEWSNLALQLSADRGKANEVSFYLQNIEPEPTRFPLYDLDVKELEKSFRNVKGNLYAAAYEVTNEDYNDFLQYLKDNDLKDILEICEIDLSKYDEPALSLLKGYHYDYPEKMKKVNRFDKYPVMDISYEAAQKYCEWLTRQYNNSPDKSHKKVVFRLPSLKEWQIAAFGYKDFTSWNIDENVVEAKEKPTDKDRDKKTFDLRNYNVLYPWWPVFNFRDKPQNKFGCYLGNFKVPDTVICPSSVPGDGFRMTSFVGAYFPNEMGLYDVVGNVAEMIDEKGKACGGSWNHPPEESTIKSINSYDGPDSSIGFRVFMEVIEE